MAASRAKKSTLPAPGGTRPGSSTRRRGAGAGAAKAARDDNASGTRDRLVSAAASEFNEVGYYGTDTNKIARAAGFAPQTFYRHFRDKMDVFLAVYEQWQADERKAVARAAREGAGIESITRAVLRHHQRWRIFRRSLRVLAVEDTRARAARARSRSAQLADLARLPANAGRPRADLVAALLRVERLFDAAADEELADLGLDAAGRFQILLAAVRACRGAAD